MLKLPDSVPLFPSESIAEAVKEPFDAIVKVDRYHHGAPGPEAKLFTFQVPVRSACEYAFGIPGTAPTSADGAPSPFVFTAVTTKKYGVLFVNDDLI
jgi:hypothetical protein